MQQKYLDESKNFSWFWQTSDNIVDIYFVRNKLLEQKQDLRACLDYSNIVNLFVVRITSFRRYKYYAIHATGKHHFRNIKRANIKLLMFWRIAVELEKRYSIWRFTFRTWYRASMWQCWVESIWRFRLGVNVVRPMG